MGNCQAIDNASLVIQHPKSGRVERMYWPVGASEIMKMNPGHYVALLLTTTLYSSPKNSNNGYCVNNDKNTPVRITRIKLLRPTDTLVLGHVYRLVTSQEVMKGVLAKKQANKTKQQQQQQADQMYGNNIITEKISSEFEAVIRKNHETDHKTKQQAKHERHRSRKNSTQVINSAVSKSRGAWQPSLKSISEAGS